MEQGQHLSTINPLKVALCQLKTKICNLAHMRRRGDTGQRGKAAGVAVNMTARGSNKMCN